MRYNPLSHIIIRPQHLVFGLYVLCSLYASPAVSTPDPCHQDNIHSLIEIYPQLRQLSDVHQAELEALEDKQQGIFEKNEQLLHKNLISIDEHKDFEDLLEKEVIETAERQYAEFWELCIEVTAK